MGSDGPPMEINELHPFHDSIGAPRNLDGLVCREWLASNVNSGINNRHRRRQRNGASQHVIPFREIGYLWILFVSNRKPVQGAREEICWNLPVQMVGGWLNIAGKNPKQSAFSIPEYYFPVTYTQVIIPGNPDYASSNEASGYWVG
jgi:hypothetical protein